MLSVSRLVIAAVILGAIGGLGAWAALRAMLKASRRARLVRDRCADPETRELFDALERTSRRARGFDAAMGLGAVAVVGLVVRGFVEPYWPEVTRVSLSAEKLHGARPLRIVQLSDSHVEGRWRLEGSLVTRATAERPDLIVFTGDALNERDGLEGFQRLMRELARIAPTFAVRGNWDVWWFGAADLFGGTGVHELRAEAVPVRIRDDEIWIVGAPVDSEEALPGLLRRVPPERYAILIHHFPAASSALGARAPDLHLAGDTHGGQVWLPGLGELVRISRMGGVWHPAGLTLRGERALYVNRGLGMEGGMPPFRLFCRPEIAVITIGAR